MILHRDKKHEKLKRFHPENSVDEIWKVQNFSKSKSFTEHREFYKVNVKHFLKNVLFSKSSQTQRKNYSNRIPL